MEKFILFVKSYRKDVTRCVSLINSIIEFNRDRLPLLISVNDGDKSLFENTLPHPTEFSHEIIEDHKIFTSKYKNKNPWLYQQTIKSQLHNMDICENYLCIDSDSYFIKDFRLKDFMFDENTPYTIMHEGKDMRELYEMTGVDSNTLFLVKFHNAILKIWPREGKMWDFGPSPYIWSNKVWKGIEEDVLKPNHVRIDDFFSWFINETKAVPLEALFYGEYLVRTRIIDILPIQPLFKFFHERSHADFYESNKLSLDAIKRIYFGIVMQSNWHKM